jgi:hypothetical protein
MSDITLTAISGVINFNFNGSLNMSNAAGGYGYFTVDSNGYLYWYNSVTASNIQLTFA